MVYANYWIKLKPAAAASKLNAAAQLNQHDLIITLQIY